MFFFLQKLHRKNKRERKHYAEDRKQQSIDVLLNSPRGWQRRGWTKTEGDDWNVYWANVYSVKQLFNPDTGFRLGDDQ